MGFDRYQRLKRAFLGARELPDAERGSYLERECGADPALRQEVEELLDALKRDEAAAQASEIPKFVGPYRIHGVIGQGGMGIVYEAEQLHPHRRVALKVVRPGLATSTLLRRFEYEAELLGRFQHPSIAQILEAGHADTPFGRQPYFAMELVDGVPIVEYARNKKLGTRQRVKLIIQVCRAVEHAHLKAVIHRDLKPANVLVDESGVPKVLDFGIARATDPDLHTTTLQTSAGQLLGTLQYMSPEQARGDPDRVDTRADVYALGAVTFELLCGRTPFDLEGKPVPEAVRIIAEDEPKGLRAHDPTLPGDLETILRKALAKDPDRRYSSAAALADDLKSYLENRPISARPTTLTYHLWKFSRRHRAVVGLAVLAVLATAAGFISTVLARIDAEHAQFDAEEEAEASRAIIDFYNNGLLASVKPNQLGKDVPMREVLDEASRKIEGRFADQPRVEAEVRRTLGRTYLQLGVLDSAQRHLERTVELTRREELEEELHLDAVDALGWAEMQLGNHVRAEELFDEMIAAREREGRGTERDTLDGKSNRAWLFFLRGNYADATEAFLEVIPHFRETLGPEDHATLTATANLGCCYLKSGRHEEADRTLRETLEVRTRVSGREDPYTLMVMSNLGLLCVDMQRFEEGIELMEETIEIRNRVLGPTHHSTLMTKGNLVLAYLSQERYEEAEALAKTTVRGTARILGNDHADVLRHRSNLARAITEQGRHEEALAILAPVFTRQRELLTDEHDNTQYSMGILGQIHVALGDLDAAEPLLTQNLDRVREEYPEPGRALVMAVSSMAQLRIAQKSWAEAQALVDEGFDLADLVLEPDDRLHEDLLALLDQCEIGD